MKAFVAKYPRRYSIEELIKVPITISTLKNRTSLLCIVSPVMPKSTGKNSKKTPQGAVNIIKITAGGMDDLSIKLIYSRQERADNK